jgi:hypothetical protein
MDVATATAPWVSCPLSVFMPAVSQSALGLSFGPPGATARAYSDSSPGETVEFVEELMCGQRRKKPLSR